MSEAINPFDYSPSRSLPARIRRRLTQWQSVAPIDAPIVHPMISFTFDDFPISAAEHGAECLSRFDLKGTFYACSGLAGQRNITGELYTEKHLSALVDAGHEIGAHTHTHLDCATNPLKTTIADIDQNMTWLNSLNVAPTSFAYPYGETTVPLKQRLDPMFSTARGILPGINRKGSDLTQLRSMELTPDAWTHRRAAEAIEAVNRNGGWLVFFTHDVRNDPSPFGVQPSVLETLARQARDSGAAVLPVFEAAARLARLTI